MARVLSWCLYLNPNNVSRLGEYLMGLKCNVEAAQLWFPEWEYRLYVHEGVKNYPKVWQFITDVCQQVKLIMVREGYPTETERYRPLFEDNEVTVVRDIDSILSKTDVDRVFAWLNTDSRLLQYREYLMPEHYAMGGGLALKGKLNHEELYIKPIDYQRGQDEDMLSVLLVQIPIKEKTIIITRMINTGIYYLFNHVDQAPWEQTLLWPVPFYDSEAGMLHYYPNCKPLKRDIDGIVQYCLQTPIKTELIHSHIHQEKYHLEDLRWIR